MFYLPTRKIVTMWRRASCSSRVESNHHRPTSLNDCIEAKPPRSFWKPWFIVLLIVPALYYINAVRLSRPGTFIQYYVPVDTVEDTRPAEMVAKNEFNVSDNEPMIKERNVIKKPRRLLPKLEDTTTQRVPGLPMCVVNYTTLGKIGVNTSRNAILLDKQYPMVKKGGFYHPPDCVSRHTVAILVPYRDRSPNLAVFLYNIHPFLINQKLEYRIFVIEQSGIELFNKGRLYNAGFKEIKKYGQWKCMVFHDVDLLPLDERILYTCPTFPRHMCATVLQKKKDTRYRALFGGVTSMTPAHYVKVNGYSNLYWGWGGEDNDMFWRLRAVRLPIVRYNKSIAEYTALPHVIRNKNRDRYKLLNSAMARYQDDGLSTVEYKVVAVNLNHLYTHLLVDVNPYKDNITVLMKAALL